MTLQLTQGVPGKILLGILLASVSLTGCQWIEDDDSEETVEAPAGDNVDPDGSSSGGDSSSGGGSSDDGGTPAQPAPPPTASTFDISIQLAGTGGRVTDSANGIDCSSNCSVTLTANTTIRLSASAASGSRFAGWGGQCSGSADCSFVLTGNASLQAQFELIANDQPPAVGALFADLPAQGDIAVTLHPGSSVPLGSNFDFAFTVPFPRAVLQDAEDVTLRDAQGQELPIFVEEIARWRSLNGDSSVDSVRALRISTRFTFSDGAPESLVVRYGNSGAALLTSPLPQKSDWVSQQVGINANEYAAAEGIMEPAVYATFEPTWLGQTLLRTRTMPAFSQPAWLQFDESMLNFGNTAVNNVSAMVTEDNLVDYESQPAPWLFDRAMTFFGFYVRTGSVDWLRHAHRAAQFYGNHVDGTGAFDLKSYRDLKYSYGHALLIDLMLTGDTSLVSKIEQIAGFANEWRDEYNVNANFWTERHLTYALLGRMAAWEATGDSAYADATIALAHASFDNAEQPTAGWPAIGCLQHTLRQHEGNDDDSRICSPWMSALFADAVWRYFIQSEDPRALNFLSGLGDYLVEHGTYEPEAGHQLEGLLMPYYLASDERKVDPEPWTDKEHSCDTAGLAARAKWSRSALGRAESAALNNTLDRLLETCAYTLDYWHREGSAASIGAPEWRLSPPRKISWWFGTTTDLPWLLAN